MPQEQVESSETAFKHDYELGQRAVFQQLLLHPRLPLPCSLLSLSISISLSLSAQLCQENSLRFWRRIWLENETYRWNLSPTWSLP